MGKVISQATMSLDGFIAQPATPIGRLFGWHDNGDVEVWTAPDLTFHLTRQSADYWGQLTTGLGHGLWPRPVRLRRRLGRPAPARRPGRGGHSPPAHGLDRRPRRRAVHVRDGRRCRRCRARPGDRGRPYSRRGRRHDRQPVPGLGLLDEVAINLVPVVMGTGRPYFVDLPADAILLGDLVANVSGNCVTHLRFPVQRG